MFVEVCTTRHLRVGRILPTAGKSGSVWEIIGGLSSRSLRYDSSKWVFTLEAMMMALRYASNSSSCGKAAGVQLFRSIRTTEHNS